MTPSITQDDINTALGNFLTTILPAGVTVIVGQVNRVASPEGNYCVMWPLRRPRLSTNVDTPVDTKFTASIASGIMTVTEIDAGSIDPTNSVFGVNVAGGTVVQFQSSGTPGGTGIYAITPPQNVTAEIMSAGTIEIEQSTEVVMQVDVHGPLAGDNVQTISTAFRDEYGVSLFAGTGITPLYCEDPRQMPFTTAADQFEERWTIDLHMQADPVLNVPQQFSDAANVTVIDVIEAFPA